MAWNQMWEGNWYNDNTGEYRQTTGNPEQEDAARFAALPDHQRAPQIWGFGGQTKSLLENAARQLGITVDDWTPYAKGIIARDSINGGQGWMVGAADAYVANHILRELSFDPKYAATFSALPAESLTQIRNAGGPPTVAQGMYLPSSQAFKATEAAGNAREEALRRSNDYSQWDDVFQAIKEVAPVALAMAGPAGFSLSSALGGGALGGAGSGALTSLITGGDPLMGALTGGLGSGISSGLSGLGLPSGVIPAATGALKAAITGGDPFSSALTAGAGSLASGALSGFGGNTQVASAPLNDGPYGEAVDMTGFQTPYTPVTADDFGPSEMDTSSYSTDPVVGALDALTNTGFVPSGQTVDLSNSQNLIPNTISAPADIPAGDTTMDDIDMTGFQTQDTPIDWGPTTLDDSSYSAGEQPSWLDQFLSPLANDGVVPNGYTVNLGNSDELISNLSGGDSSSVPVGALSGLLKTIMGGGAAASGALKTLMGGGSGGTGSGGSGGALKDLLPLLMIGGVLEGMFKNNSTTTKTELPEWLTAGGKSAIASADAVAGQEFKPYTGEAIAPLSDNEKQAIQMAKDAAGQWQPVLDKSQALTESSAGALTPELINQYMNPYLDLVYAPAKRQLEKDAAAKRIAEDARAGRVGAFGGTRNAVAKGVLDQNELTAYGDLYGSTYAKGWDSATGLATNQKGREANAGGALRSLATTGAELSSNDITNLGKTGAVERSLRQAQDDFNVGQYKTEQDWPLRSVSAYATALRGTGDAGKTTTATPPSPSLLGQATGALGAMQSADKLGWFS